MPESFGARLRRRREQRGVSLAAIARQTKIKESLLDGLEREDFTYWPSRIYRRAFVRAYAIAIDLDPDAVVQEFLELHPDPPESDVLAAMASAADRTNGGSRPGSAIRSAVGSALGSLSRRVRNTPMDNSPAANGPLNVAPLQPPAVAHARTPCAPAVVTPIAPPPRTIPPPVVEETLFEATPIEPIEIAYESEPAPGPEEPLTAPEEPAAPVPGAAISAAFEPAPDLLAVAQLCTEFVRVRSTTEMRRCLDQAAMLLDATGLIVWVSDAAGEQLAPALVHGYPEKVVAQLPLVNRDAENATAAAFRSGEARAIEATASGNGALVVPLLANEGCEGVLAIELQRGKTLTNALLAIATIVAAFLTQFIEAIPSTAQLGSPMEHGSPAIALGT